MTPEQIASRYKMPMGLNIKAYHTLFTQGRHIASYEDVKGEIVGDYEHYLLIKTKAGYLTTVSKRDIYTGRYKVVGGNI